MSEDTAYGLFLILAGGMCFAGGIGIAAFADWLRGRN